MAKGKRHPPPPDHNRKDDKRRKRELWTRYRERCALCGGPLPFGEMTLDHIQPRAHGGPFLWRNLQPAHAACNVRRGTLSLEEWARLTGHTPLKPDRPKRRPD